MQIANSTTTTAVMPRPRWAVLALTAAVHLALLLCWRQARLPAREAPERMATMTWLRFGSLPSARSRSVPPVRPASPLAARSDHPMPRMPPVAITAPAVPPLPPPAAMPFAKPQPQPQPASPARTADDILQQARRDIGKIDRDLRKGSLSRLIQAPPNTSQTRLERGFADAAAAVPPKWFEAPRMEEILDEGGYDRRRYRVTTAGGTYCVTYESNHGPDGQDIMQRGIRLKTTTCPAYEQPPTTQP